MLMYKKDNKCNVDKRQIDTFKKNGWSVKAPSAKKTSKPATDDTNKPTTESTAAVAKKPAKRSVKKAETA